MNKRVIKLTKKFSSQCTPRKSLKFLFFPLLWYLSDFHSQSVSYLFHNPKFASQNPQPKTFWSFIFVGVDSHPIISQEELYTRTMNFSLCFLSLPPSIVYKYLSTKGTNPFQRITSYNSPNSPRFHLCGRLASLCFQLVEATTPIMFSNFNLYIV